MHHKESYCFLDYLTERTWLRKLPLRLIRFQFGNHQRMRILRRCFDLSLLKLKQQRWNMKILRKKIKTVLKKFVCHVTAVIVELERVQPG